MAWSHVNSSGDAVAVNLNDVALISAAVLVDRPAIAVQQPRDGVVPGEARGMGDRRLPQPRRQNRLNSDTAWPSPSARWW